MTFASIPHGSRLFLDANTLVYYFTADLHFDAACLQLVDRIARQEIQGITSAQVVADVAHRVMTLEAMHAFGLPAKGIVAHLRQHPAVVQKLTRFRQAVDLVAPMGIQVMLAVDYVGRIAHCRVDLVAPMGIQVMPLDLALASRAAARGQQYGLLTGDALIVAVMEHYLVTELARNDADFDRVPGLTRYAPA
jgi:predicted nucleic acid-binding protein